VTVQIRRATSSDTDSILEVHRAAFDSDVEPKLVADLLNAPEAHPLVSVIAEDEGTVVAHVLLTSGLVPGHPDVKVQLLAPLAVLPRRQGRGIGTKVTQAALQDAREAGVDCVCVLGHPSYYPRFGFAPLLPGGPLPLIDPAPEHTDAWMTLFLGVDQVRTASALDGIRLIWAGPLDDPGLWGPD
jgi:predicted N-acetyltransferase YhbS